MSSIVATALVVGVLVCIGFVLLAAGEAFGRLTLAASGAGLTSTVLGIVGVFAVAGLAAWLLTLVS